MTLTTVLHYHADCDTAQNSSDNLLSYPLNNHDSDSTGDHRRTRADKYRCDDETAHL